MKFKLLSQLPLCFFLCTAFSLVGLNAHAALNQTLKIEGVTASASNYVATGVSGYVSCQEFKGTHHDNDIWVRPLATGGSGRYRHTLAWSLDDGYELGARSERQFEVVIGDDYVYRIHLPKLKDEIPFIQQSLFLITKDLKTGEVKSTNSMFVVSRGVILSQSASTALVKENCYERYPAYESTVGILSNGSSNPSQLTVKQGVQRLFESTSGSSWGFYFSPFGSVGIGGFSLGGLLNFHRSHFQSVSKQTLETVEVASEYQLSPGDFVQIYTQKTRYITAYDARIIGVCGDSEQVDGAYRLQWWGFAYHAVPVNPYATTRPNPESIGVRPMNTCPVELTPEGENVTGEKPNLEFVRTNI